MIEAINQAGFARLNLDGVDRWEINWNPTRTGWTDVGTPTVTTRQRTVGKKCEFQMKVVPATTVATVAGTSYVNLPFTAAGIAGEVSMSNATANTAVGLGVIDIANSRAYLPSQAATGNTLTIAGWFEVQNG